MEKKCKVGKKSNFGEKTKKKEGKLEKEMQKKREGKNTDFL